MPYVANPNKTYPILPSEGYIQLRFINGEPGCVYSISTNIPALSNIYLESNDYYENKFVETNGGTLSLTITITTATNDCPDLPKQTYNFEDGKAYTIFLQPKVTTQMIDMYEDQVQKSTKANPIVRTLVNLDGDHKLTWRSIKIEVNEYEGKISERKLIELNAGKYEVLIDGNKVHEETLKFGGVYALVIGKSTEIVTNMFIITEPNSMSMLWLIPQYVVLSLGEIMFSITGLDFSYSQAPKSLKSVLLACWLLTNGIGNILVVIIAKIDLFESQAHEFFLFAGLMLADMGIFMWMAYRYKSNVPEN